MDSINSTNSSGAVGVALIEHPHPDEAWILTLPPGIQHVARRHGRALTSYCMQLNNAGVAVNVLTRRCRGNHELEQAIHFLVGVANDFGASYVKSMKWTDAQVAEAHQDIMRVLSLTQPGAGETRSASGLILPN